MNRTCQICQVVMVIGFANMILFMIIAAFIGGDAFSTQAEGGRYYLSTREEPLEVSIYTFFYSKLHARSLCITHPLMMIAGLIYAGGQCWRRNTAYFANLPQQPATGIWSVIKNALKNIHWGILDWHLNLGWLLFDTWRKPSLEFFTKTASPECVRLLNHIINEDPPVYGLEADCFGYFSTSYFQIYRGVFDNRLKPLFITGKLISTPHGTYVRLWHRLNVWVIVFVIIWFIIITTAAQPDQALNSLIYILTLSKIVLAMIGLMTILLIPLSIIGLMYIGTWFGQWKYHKILDVIYQTLKR